MLILKICQFYPIVYLICKPENGVNEEFQQPGLWGRGFIQQKSQPLALEKTLMWQAGLRRICHVSVMASFDHSCVSYPFLSSSCVIYRKGIINMH